MINNVSSSYPIASPLVNQPVGRQAVGQESVDLKSSSFKPTEQSAESARQENRRLPGDSPSQDAEGSRLSDARGQAAPVNDREQRKQQAEKQRREAEQKIVDQLSARDREVRAHEQAHAAVGGQYAGSPTYTYQRGPDGVSYAIGGEVSIDTSPIPNDPEATLRKAEQIARAANAPAEPSGQDRAVAAQAAKMAQQARVEISRQSQEKVQEKEPIQSEEVSSVDNVEARKAAEREALEKQRQEEEEIKEQLRLESQRQSFRALELAELQRKNITTNRRLLEIDSFERFGAGRLVDSRV
jgi:hypothetical protein